LYRSRILFFDFIATSRRYCEDEEKSFDRSRPRTFNEATYRSIWQRELYSHIFSGRRSRSNSVYSQQLIGNLQLVRRLFSVSWSPRERSFSPYSRKKGRAFLRQKISLDQSNFDSQKNIFELEELGKTPPLKVENGKERKQVLSCKNSFSTKVPKTRKLGNWVLLFKKSYFSEICVETNPLYACWDYKRHALILSNRLLPTNKIIRTKTINEREIKTYADPNLFLKVLGNHSRKENRKEFLVLPKNPQTRRMRLCNVRYTRRALLQRRALTTDPTLTIDFAFLSQDRSIWRRKATGWDSSMFAFWFNPHSDVQRDRNMKANYPVRSCQSFPLSLECRTRPRTYTPGDLQPLIRGGLVWPGTDPFVCFQKSYYRPGLDQSHYLLFEIIYLF
jgi:hypothetical protein